MPGQGPSPLSSLLLLLHDTVSGQMRGHLERSKTVIEESSGPAMKSLPLLGIHQQIGRRAARERPKRKRGSRQAEAKLWERAGDLERLRGTHDPANHAIVCREIGQSELPPSRSKVDSRSFQSILKVDFWAVFCYEKEVCV